MNAKIKVAIILAAMSLSSLSQASCVVGDIDANDVVPTMIQSCNTTNNSPVGSNNGSWLIVTTCLEGKVAIRSDQGWPVYKGAFVGAVVSCVSPAVAVSWYNDQIKAAQSDVKAVSAYLPKGIYDDAWCKTKGYDYSIDAVLGYCAKY